MTVIAISIPADAAACHICQFLDGADGEGTRCTLFDAWLETDRVEKIHLRCDECMLYELESKYCPVCGREVAVLGDDEPRWPVCGHDCEAGS